MKQSGMKLLAGPLLAGAVFWALPVTYMADGLEVALPEQARWTLAITAWMAAWWISEAAPLAATSLIPLVIFPVVGINTLKAVCAAYAHPLIFLFMGGFMVAIAIEKWSLHRWMALNVIRAWGGSPRRLLAGFMLMGAIASMWLSNTATAIMMLPVATSVLTDLGDRLDATERQRFDTVLLLGIAYSASIGGMGTLIGSPPNLFVASYLADNYGIEIGFFGWIKVALPIVLVLLPLAWFALSLRLTPHLRDLQIALPEAPVMSWRALPPGARRVGLVFLLMVCGWLARPWIQAALSAQDGLAASALSDTTVALGAALALLLLQAGRNSEALLSWQDAEGLPWGTLLLFGGGLAIASAIGGTGADAFLGTKMLAVLDAPEWLVMFSLVGLVVLMTEITSNTATTAALAPLVAILAMTIGLSLDVALMVTALAAGCAFMMPVATPPNAIVFASGRLRVSSMAKAGVVVNLLAITVLTIAAVWWMPWVR